MSKTCFGSGKGIFISGLSRMFPFAEPGVGLIKILYSKWLAWHIFRFRRGGFFMSIPCHPDPGRKKAQKLKQLSNKIKCLIITN